MKRLLCLFLAALFLLTAGCQSVSEPGPGVSPSTEEAAPSPSPAVSPSDIAVDPGGPEDTPIPLEVGDPGALAYLLSAFGGDAESGYIADTAAEVAEQIAQAGIIEGEIKAPADGLEADIASGRSDRNVYTFTMTNAGPLRELEAEGDILYAAEYYTDGAAYAVILGAAGVSPYEEALLYCFEGDAVTYFAAAMVMDDLVLLFPVVAGSDYDGFWAVRPVLAYIGLDVSGMYSLLGGGDPDGDMVSLSLTDYEAGGDSSRVYYEFLNNCPFGVTSAEETFVLNGEDVSGSTFGYFEADAYSTHSDYLLIMDVRIMPGDVMEISMDLFSEDFDNLGSVTFTFRFE